MFDVVLPGMIAVGSSDLIGFVNWKYATASVEKPFLPDASGIMLLRIMFVGISGKPE